MDKSMKLKKIMACSLGLLTALTLLGGCKSGGDGSLPQFDQEIQEGEEIAVITVKGYGEIKVRFFPDEAPKAVENFTTHAKEGYYDGLTFHRVIADFMIQGGDPKGDGTGGESIWGEGFGPEPSDKLYHFPGALCMAQSSMPNSIGSQFYIVQGDDVTEEYLDQLEVYYDKTYPDIVKEKYLELGGVPHLDGDYTVFGQVFEGMDVVEKIAGCETDGNDLPKQAVTIEKIEVVEYQK